MHWACKLHSWPSFRITQALQEMIFLLRCSELLAFPQLQNLDIPDIISYNYLHVYSKCKCLHNRSAQGCEMSPFSYLHNWYKRSSRDLIYHWWRRKIADVRKLSDLEVWTQPVKYTLPANYTHTPPQGGIKIWEEIPGLPSLARSPMLTGRKVKFPVSFCLQSSFLQRRSWSVGGPPCLPVYTAPSASLCAHWEALQGPGASLSLFSLLLRLLGAGDSGVWLIS